MSTRANPHFINGHWQPGSGEFFSAENPSTNEEIWRGASASEAEVERAMEAARQAKPGWAALSVAARAEFLQRFAALLETRATELARVISLEVGKPPWEALGEVQAMVGKAALTLEAYELRCRELHNRGAITRFRPHGVVAVLGPFNFPGHLPNGHIMPALLAGNCVIFKPSDKAPWVAEETIRLWEEVGLPPGVLQLLQGGSETAQCVARHAELDGLYFTGSTAVGMSLTAQLAARPNVLLALELGGNNPLILHRGLTSEQAVPLVLQAAFSSGGQRCNCTRRLILTDNAPVDFLETLVEAARQVRTGPPEADPPAFYGPLIRRSAVEVFLREQEALKARGGVMWLEGKALGGAGNFVSPGIWEVNPEVEPDAEIFAPLLRVVRVKDLSAAIEAANSTRYGLAAALLSTHAEDWARAQVELRAGVLNWNQPTTAATSAAPFGGIGLSGNHRPSAYFAVDYCAYPVAILESPQPSDGPWPPGLLPA